MVFLPVKISILWSVQQRVCHCRNISIWRTVVLTNDKGFYAWIPTASWFTYGDIWKKYFKLSIEKWYILSPKYFCHKVTSILQYVCCNIQSWQKQLCLNVFINVMKASDIWSTITNYKICFFTLKMTDYISGSWNLCRQSLHTISEYDYICCKILKQFSTSLEAKFPRYM